jgi:hypothetical protein
MGLGQLCVVTVERFDVIQVLLLYFLKTMHTKRPLQPVTEADDGLPLRHLRHLALIVAVHLTLKQIGSRY